MIPIDEHELTTNHMTKQCDNSMERFEAKIENDHQPLFDRTDPDRLHCSAFGDSDDDDDNVLPYGEESQDQK